MRKILAAAAIAAFAAFGLSAPAQAAMPDNAATNQASYWEAWTGADDECTKVELADGIDSYTLSELPAGQVYTLLVLKAGSGASANTVVQFPEAGVAYMHSSGKDISHVIYCVAEDSYES